MKKRFYILCFVWLATIFSELAISDSISSGVYSEDIGYLVRVSNVIGVFKIEIKNKNLQECGKYYSYQASVLDPLKGNLSLGDEIVFYSDKSEFVGGGNFFMFLMKMDNNSINDCFTKNNPTNVEVYISPIGQPAEFPIIRPDLDNKKDEWFFLKNVCFQDSMKKSLVLKDIPMTPYQKGTYNWECSVKVERGKYSDLKNLIIKLQNEK